MGSLKEKTEFSILLVELKLEDVLVYDGGEADAFIESCDKRIIGAEKESSIFLKRDAPSFLSWKVAQFGGVTMSDSDVLELRIDILELRDDLFALELDLFVLAFSLTSIVILKLWVLTNPWLSEKKVG